ncbi:acyl-CoA reductase [Bacteroidota bacterium]
MKLEERIYAFDLLGNFLSQFTKKNNIDNSLKSLNDKFFNDFNDIIINSHIFNPWFTEENVREAILSISDLLNKNQLGKWLSQYQINSKSAKKIGVVLAGNIPLVGFHDFLSVLITGNIFIGKLSSKDNKIFPIIKSILSEINKEFEHLIFFPDDKLENIDVVIATGSNNSARYFNYYFGKYPNIIRKNRNSIAVLNGKESEGDLDNLGKDIFQYYGLGCRNVSKLFIPENYNFNIFFKAIEKYKNLYDHNKYANNVDYNRAIYLMNKTPHLDNGFLLLKEDAAISSPLGVVYYSYYSLKKELKQYFIYQSDKIQCIVAGDSSFENAIPFGQSQHPELWDYADGIDTIEFLIKL